MFWNEITLYNTYFKYFVSKSKNDYLDLVQMF